MTAARQGVPVRKRAGRVSVTLRSRVMPAPASVRPPMAVVASGLELLVRGTLSSGSLGWRLSARASCYRRTISVEVTAVRNKERLRLGVEDQVYEITLGVPRAGRYLLRVNHVWVINPELGELLIIPTYEAPVTFQP